jgi:ABC-type amino acid transport substrate-binding protein
MTQTTPPETSLPTPFRCLTGALIAGAMSIALYALTSRIAMTFATKPMIQKTNMAVNIATALRTLVVGSTALGAGVFGIIAIGLIGLAIQVAFSKSRSSTNP